VASFVTLYGDTGRVLPSFADRWDGALYRPVDDEDAYNKRLQRARPRISSSKRCSQNVLVGHVEVL